MNKYPSPIIIMVFGLLCVVAGALLAYGCEKYDNREFSPPKSTAGDTSPSSVGYLRSIEQTQQQIKDLGYDIKVDGMLCGACYNPGHSQTQELWDIAYNMQSALETWPETEK